MSATATATAVLPCRYCGKPCVLPEEIARGDRTQTVCNPCGGYERCIRCGKPWENLHFETGERECYDCENNDAVKGLIAKKGITEDKAWELIGGRT